MKNLLNSEALWSVIISVPPLFFHTLSDRDVDFINSPRERDSFAKDVSCIFGGASREIRMEVEGMLEVDLVTGTRGSNQYFPISAVVTEPSDVCIHTVLHECILTICTSHVALSETRAGHRLCHIALFSPSLVIGWILTLKPNTPMIQSLCRPLVSGNYRWRCSRTSLHGWARLHFCNFIMLLEKYTLKTRVSQYRMVFQCIVTIFFVWFLSSWLSKAYFLNTVWEAVLFVDVTK